MATVGLREAARHLETSVESIRRGIRAGRLQRSIVNDGGRLRVDLAIATQEWRDATSTHQVAQREHHRAARARRAPGSPEDFPTATWSVLRDGSRVLLCEAVGDPPDLDRPVYLMTPDGARELAAALIRIADDPTQTFPAPPVYR